MTRYESDTVNYDEFREDSQLVGWYPCGIIRKMTLAIIGAPVLAYVGFKLGQFLTGG